MNDPFGAAISDYFFRNKNDKIIINSNYTEDEHILPAYFFRNWDEMPPIEQKAITLAKGKTLDIGAAAGCHSLILQDNDIEVTALDISAKSCEVMQQRGVKKVINQDIFTYSNEKFDTILLLMNGAGMGGTVDRLEIMLKHFKTLLHDNGQILLDSSDIKYLFYEDDGSFWVDLNNNKYYGEMQYEVQYNLHTAKFNWLYIDYELLSKIAKDCGFKDEKILNGAHHQYLARLF